MVDIPSSTPAIDATERKIFLSLTKSTVREWAHPTDFQEFVREKLTQNLFEVGFSGQKNWRQVCDLVVESLTDSLRRCHDYPYDDLIESIREVAPDSRTETLTRLYGHLLDSFLVGADNFSANFSFHEFSKDLIFILEDFVEQQGDNLIPDVASSANENDVSARTEATAYSPTGDMVSRHKAFFSYSLTVLRNSLERLPDFSFFMLVLYLRIKTIGAISLFCPIL